MKKKLILKVAFATKKILRTINCVEVQVVVRSEGEQVPSHSRFQVLVRR